MRKSLKKISRLPEGEFRYFGQLFDAMAENGEEISPEVKQLIRKYGKKREAGKEGQMTIEESIQYYKDMGNATDKEIQKIKELSSKKNRKKFNVEKVQDRTLSTFLKKYFRDSNLNRIRTFEKFAFTTMERETGIFRSNLEQIRQDEPSGCINVNELWSNTNQFGVLREAKFHKDKRNLTRYTYLVSLDKMKKRSAMQYGIIEGGVGKVDLFKKVKAGLLKVSNSESRDRDIMIERKLRLQEEKEKKKKKEDRLNLDRMRRKKFKEAKKNVEKMTVSARPRRNNIITKQRKDLIKDLLRDQNRMGGSFAKRKEYIPLDDKKKFSKFFSQVNLLEQGTNLEKMYIIVNSGKWNNRT